MVNNKVQGFRVNMPEWLSVLDTDNAVIAHALEGVTKLTKGIKTVDGTVNTEKTFVGSPYFKGISSTGVDADNGILTFEIVPNDDLYYRVLSEVSGQNIVDKNGIVAYISGVAKKAREFDKLQVALADMNATGYGVVNPSFENVKLEKPVLYKNGKSFGVKFKANGSSIHLVKVDVGCEVAPIIGEQAQSEEMLKYLVAEYESGTNTIWETPIFGKSLESIVRDDIATKAASMPALAKGKMQKTLGRIVNNGKGGVICILL